MRIPTQQETDELKKEVEKDLYAPNELESRLMTQRTLKERQRRAWGRPS